MKMQALKQRVWKIWSKLNSFRGELVAVPQSYVAEIKSFGDRRYKKTWVKALARLQAIYLHRNCLDAWMLITENFNFTSDRWDYEFRYEILDEFLQYSDGLELIKTGLEQIFTSTDFTADEQQETSRNGFFELLAGREGQHPGLSLSVGSIRQLAGTNTAA